MCINNKARRNEKDYNLENVMLCLSYLVYPKQNEIHFST